MVGRRSAGRGARAPGLLLLVLVLVLLGLLLVLLVARPRAPRRPRPPRPPRSSSGSSSSLLVVLVLGLGSSSSSSSSSAPRRTRPRAPRRRRPRAPRPRPRRRLVLAPRRRTRSPPVLLLAPAPRARRASSWVSTTSPSSMRPRQPSTSSGSRMVRVITWRRKCRSSARARRPWASPDVAGLLEQALGVVLEDHQDPGQVGRELVEGDGAVDVALLALASATRCARRGSARGSWPPRCGGSGRSGP